MGIQAEKLVNPASPLSQVFSIEIQPVLRLTWGLMLTPEPLLGSRPVFGQRHLPHSLKDLAYQRQSGAVWTLRLDSWGNFLVLPLPGHAALRQSLNLSEPHCHHL